jgi:hypothetical protein
MITTTLYEITVETLREYDWTGLFLMKPTIYDVESAIILDIESLSGHDDSMDEEDEEQAAYHIERLEEIQQIVAQVGDDDFVNQHGTNDVTVASVTIGTILVEAKKTYDAGEPAEVRQFSDRYYESPT